MTVFIVSSTFRGKKFPVLLKKDGAVFHVIDIGGYNPECFPKNVGISAIRKVSPKHLDVPVLENQSFDLTDFTL